jgi:hypothetical protein
MYTMRSDFKQGQSQRQPNLRCYGWTVYELRNKDENYIFLLYYFSFYVTMKFQLIKSILFSFLTLLLSDSFIQESDKRNVKNAELDPVRNRNALYTFFISFHF